MTIRSTLSQEFSPTSLPLLISGFVGATSLLAVRKVRGVFLKRKHPETLSKYKLGKDADTLLKARRLDPS